MGKDSNGNKYYESKSGKRWVIYNDEIDASKITNEWYSWMHFTPNKIEKTLDSKKYMSKLPHIGTSIFTVMSQMATEHNAINLSQGFPNFPVDKRLIDIFARLASENVHQYSPMSGYPPLLEKIAKLTQQSYRRIVNHKSEILII